MLRQSKTAHYCEGEGGSSSSSLHSSSPHLQNKTMSPRAASVSNLGSVDSGEVFLRNPRTGGFDFTPAQLEQSPRRRYRGPHYISSDEEETLQDSTVYTSYTTKPLLQGQHLQSSSLSSSSGQKPRRKQPNTNTKATTKNYLNPIQSFLSPRSQTSFQRYFHSKSGKTPTQTFISPPQRSSNRSTVPVTPPTKLKSVSSALEKLKCRVISSPPAPSTRPEPERVDSNRRRQDSESQSSTSEIMARNARIMNSASRRRPQTSPKARMVTPPRSGRSPTKESPAPLPPDSTPEKQPSPNASSASCLEFSFSTLNRTNDSFWNFDPVSSPLCGTPNQVVEDEAKDTSVEMSFCNTRLFGNESSGFEGDIDDSTLDILSPDTLSLASPGALLLTEEGLKRHNDKKLEQETVESLTLRQPNGVGKLEKEVLKQKVQRLQAKEVKKQAETSLEMERAARKKLLAKARQQQQQQELNQSPPRGAAATSPISTSPQVSTGEKSPSPAKKATSFFSKVLPWKKKPNAEELKRQWKERERQRVELARLEKEEQERLEKERIEELRKSYLEKQRALEAEAAAKVIIDVDDLIETNAQDSEWGSSTMSPSLGPCTVCQRRERTHIAMPCMHFAFCGPCVKDQTMCPMCTAENVTFSRVNTE